MAMIDNFMNDAGLDGTVAAMTSFHDDEIQTAGCLILSMCAQYNGSRRNVRRNDAKLCTGSVYQALHKAFTCSPNNENTCRAAAFAISLFLKNDFKLYFDDIIPGRLITYMRKFTSGCGLPFSSDACFIIKLLCENDHRRKLEFGDLGACQLIHNAMLNEVCLEQLWAIDALLFASSSSESTERPICTDNHDRFSKLGTISVIDAVAANEELLEEVQVFGRKLSHDVSTSRQHGQLPSSSSSSTGKRLRLK
jgi:hypothetical protein